MRKVLLLMFFRLCLTVLKKALRYLRSMVDIMSHIEGGQELWRHIAFLLTFTGWKEFVGIFYQYVFSHGQKEFF